MNMLGGIWFWRLVFLTLITILLSMALHTGVAEGAEYFILRKAAIEGGMYKGTNHDYFLELDRTGEKLQHTTNLYMHTDVVCVEMNELCMFWNNDILSKASESQYRSVAWSFRLGFAVGKHVELGWSHTSTHELDRKSSEFARFGLENVLFLQLKWYERNRFYYQ